MDINHCIDHLGLNRNTYRLTQSNPPHEFLAWDGPDPQPTQEELEVAWVQIQAAYGNDYARKRLEEYPPVGDQLDSILKWANLMRMDGTNLPEDLDQTIAQWLSVKQKHPK
jgi:hypothetical protein